MNAKRKTRNKVYKSLSEMKPEFAEWRTKLGDARRSKFSGICGFDEFIDTFIQMKSPATMAEFGPSVAAAAGISTSYLAHNIGDKFGGNGPLLTSALHGILGDAVATTYIGALGADAILPIFQAALGGKTKMMYSLAAPAHSDCIEFSDGKIMLSDLRSCSEIDWNRLVERVGDRGIDALLAKSDFVAAVNWGKLPNVGDICDSLVVRLERLNIPRKKLIFFMDLAEFEQRSIHDRRELLSCLSRITARCNAILSLNLKEAWQLPYKFNNVHEFTDAEKENTTNAINHRETLEEPRIIGTDADRIKVGRNMSDMWATFARTSHPEAKGQPEWPEYTLERRAIMMINANCSAVDDPFKAERELWYRLDSGRV